MEPEYILNDESIAYILRGWLYQQDISTPDLFEFLRDSIEFKTAKIKVRGKEYDSPRLVAFQGEDYVHHHRYSGVSHTVDNYAPVMRELSDLIIDEFGVPFNSTIIQLYRDRYDYIGYHSDKEISGEFNNTVIGLSLGGTRRFYFKHKETKEVTKTEVHDGDLLVMTGTTQRDYMHTVPKQAGVQPRISITWRLLKNYD